MKAQGHLPIGRKSIGQDGNDGQNAIMYFLFPSVSAVKVKDGVYSTTTISCKLKYVNGSSVTTVTTLPANHTMKYKIDSGSVTSYTINSNITINTASTQIEFYLYNNSVLIDSYTILVISDGSAGKAGENGVLYRYLGEYVSTKAYVYTTEVRDIVAYKGMFFAVYKQGTSLTGVTPPTTLSEGQTDGYWLVFNNEVAIAADTAIIDGGNIGGFSFSRIKNDDGTDKIVNGNIVGVMKSQATTADGKTPMLSLNSETGEIQARKGTFNGVNIIDGDITATDGYTKVHISPNIGGMKISYDGVDKTTFSGEDKDASDIYGTNSSSEDVSITRLTSTYAQNLFSQTSANTGDILYGQNQSSSQDSYDLMKGMNKSTFTISRRSLVKFAPAQGSSSVVTMQNVIPTGVSESEFYSFVIFQVTERTTGKGGYATIYANYNTGDGDVASSVQVRWEGFSVILEAGTYDINVYSNINAYIYEDLSGTIAMNAFLYAFDITVDPTAYSSQFFGNGMAIGTSEDHHFMTVNEDGIQFHELVSGAAGVRISEDCLEFKVDGTWRTVGRDSKTGYMTLT